MEIYRCQNADVRDALTALRTIEGGDASNAGKSDVEWFLKDAGNHLYLAMEEGEPIGYLIAYSLQRIDCKDVMVLCYQLVVKESHRRRGAGLLLLCALIAQCEMNGVTKLSAVVEKKNEAAMGLFEKAGGKRQEDTDEVTFSWGG